MPHSESQSPGLTENGLPLALEQALPGEGWEILGHGNITYLRGDSPTQVTGVIVDDRDSDYPDPRFVKIFPDGEQEQNIARLLKISAAFVVEVGTVFRIGGDE